MESSEQPRPAAPSGSGARPWVLGIVVGGLAGFCFSGVVSGGLGYVLARREFRKARAGWNLQPVVVASEAIPAGTVVTFEMISQRPVPEQFVTDSIIKPDSANYLVGQRVLTPLEMGDPVRWTDIAVGHEPADGDRMAAWIREAAAKGAGPGTRHPRPRSADTPR